MPIYINELVTEEGMNSEWPPTLSGKLLYPSAYVNSAMKQDKNTFLSVLQ